jgi:hypothetical protein
MPGNRPKQCGRCCADPRSWWAPGWRRGPEAPDLTEAETREALERLDPLWDELFPAEQARIVRLLVERVEVGPAGADIRLRVAGLASLSATWARVRLTRRERRRERGGQHHGPGAAAIRRGRGGRRSDAGARRRRAALPTRAGPPLLKALARRSGTSACMDEGRYASISEMAEAEKIERGYLGTLLRLTLLTPDLIEAILDGRQPHGLGFAQTDEALPSAWADQRAALAVVRAGDARSSIKPQRERFPVGPLAAGQDGTH